jgi:hypothetical protein
MRRILLALAVVTLATWPLSRPGGGGAQGIIEVRSVTATADFPNGIEFRVEAAAGGGFDEVRLVYERAPDGVRASAIAECTEGTLVNCSYRLQATPETLLIPGAEVTYFWELTSGGVTEETASQAIVYEDTRFEWRTVSEGNVTVWYYRGGEDEARGILAAARESLDAMGALLQTTVSFPVKVRYYASAREMQPAIISDGGSGILGEVVYSDTALVSADTAPEDITRHEVAHIVVREAVRGPFDVPLWLNEGTAVYAQRQPLSGHADALDLAIRSNTVLSVRALVSASGRSQGDVVSLFYGQSWSTVKFLIETYGEERFGELFRTFREGASVTEGFQRVYGLDLDGLENAWRESVGLPPRPAATPEPDGIEAVPTADAPSPGRSPSRAGGDGTPVGLIAAIAAVTVALAGGIVVTAVLLARRLR